MNCNACTYAMPCRKPIEEGVDMMELTCYRRQSVYYLKPANTTCPEFNVLTYINPTAS